jgi:hypothetical protein
MKISAHGISYFCNIVRDEINENDEGHGEWQKFEKCE